MSLDPHTPEYPPLYLRHANMKKSRCQELAEGHGVLYFMIAWYNVTLLTAQILFVVWNIDSASSRHGHQDSSFSFGYPFMFQTLNSLCAVVVYTMSLYYGTCVHESSHFRLRFYVASISMLSSILYIWLILALALRLDHKDVACVVIVAQMFPWFSLVMFLYHLAFESARSYSR